jgi:hypothetical protein
MTYWRLATDLITTGVSIAPAGSSCYLFKDREQAVAVSFVPPVDKIARAWESFDKSALVKLEPCPVSIQMQGLPFGPGEQQKIHSSLAKQLQSEGFTLEQGASTVFSLRVERRPAKQSQVREFGAPRINNPGETVTYTPTVCSIQLTRDGTVLWSQSRLNSPFTVFDCEENETSQQAVNRICQPTPNFFFTVRLPKPGFLMPEGEPYLGGTSFTANGIQ